MAERNKWFWCEGWRQQINELVCIRRYTKGLKKCKGCEQGKALLQLKIAN